MVSIFSPDVEPAAGILSHSDTRVRPNTDAGDDVWLTVGVPVHPKCTGWGESQGSVSTSQDLAQQTGNTISL